MSQNFQTFDPNTQPIGPCVLNVEPVPIALKGAEEADWEICEFDATEEAEFEELTKLFVPFEPDFD